MTSVTVCAPAKINLTLDITGKRSDGYHTVDMVMQAVSLYDTVEITLLREEEIRVSCTEEAVPSDKRNTAYQAAQLFFKETGRSGGASVLIKKQIPMEAGLAGGSSDAAAVLLGLNKIYGGLLSSDELLRLACSIGSDVPFCLYGGTMRATGTGTQLQNVYQMPDCCIVLVKPPVGVSTKEAYALCDGRGYDMPVHSGELVACFKRGNIHDAARSLYNAFEQVLKLAPVKEIKEKLLSFGAGGACMSGSGPTVFGIFTNEQKAYECAEAFTKDFQEIFVVKPIQTGCFIKQAE